MAILSDANIASLLAERKPMPAGFSVRTSSRGGGHSEQQFDTIGASGSRFRVLLRQSLHNSQDFSAILLYSVPGTNAWFRLRRYNGTAHVHTNHIERNVFSFVTHIHKATERYQDIGRDPDGYAEQTDRYAALEEALECLLLDCGFDLPPKPPTPQMAMDL